MSFERERYFEKEGGRWPQFWAVTLDGKKVKQRFGDMGVLGQEKRTAYAAAAEAKTELEKLVKAHVKSGFEEHDGPAVYVTGKGKRPLAVRVALDKDEVFLTGFYSVPKQLDLSPLAKVKSMGELTITAMKLASLDLKPLAACGSLKVLDFSHTGLETVDLSPLKKCKSLADLGLHHFKTIDLSGLAGARSLSSLKVMNGAYKHIDLAPLMKVPTLQNLHVQNNEKLKSIDVRVLAKHPSLELITVDAPLEVEGADECKFEIRRFD